MTSKNTDFSSWDILYIFPGIFRASWWGIMNDTLEKNYLKDRNVQEKQNLFVLLFHKH
jgi:hypothetical protein